MYIHIGYMHTCVYDAYMYSTTCVFCHMIICSVARVWMSG